MAFSVRVVCARKIGAQSWSEPRGVFFFFSFLIFFSFQSISFIVNICRHDSYQCILLQETEKLANSQIHPNSTSRDFCGEVGPGDTISEGSSCSGSSKGND